MVDSLLTVHRVICQDHLINPTSQEDTMRISNREIPLAIARPRTDFVTHNGTVRGVNNPQYVDSGRLGRDWADELYRHVTGIGVSYIVFSYSTPMAWVLVDGRIVFPERKYSSTTSRHQSLIAQGFREPMGCYNPVQTLEASRKLRPAFEVVAELEVSA